LPGLRRLGASGYKRRNRPGPLRSRVRGCSGVARTFTRPRVVRAWGRNTFTRPS